MSDPTGMFTQIRENFAGMLRGKDYFSTDPAIPVYTEKQKTLEDEIRKGVMQFGISALITTVVGRSGQNQIPNALFFKDIAVIAHSFETPKLNLKTNVSASDLAEAIAWFGKGFCPFGGYSLQLKDIILGQHPTCVVYHTIFTMEGKLSTAPVRPAPNP